MRMKAFSEEQIALALRDEETETPATEVCRKMGVSEQSFYRGNVDQHGHRDTNSGNTPVCAYCHANGANSPRPAPSPPAPAGTDPGCFNSTLCHPFGGA